MGSDQAGPICVSDPSVAALEDPRYTIGQRPCRDAFRTGLPVHAPRLDSGALARWPSFVELAQASGMIAIQLSIPVSDALLRIRAHAFAHDQAVAETAVEIVARRLRPADDHHTETGV